MSIDNTVLTKESKLAETMQQMGSYQKGASSALLPAEMPMAQRQKYASQLFLAKELAYRDLEDKSTIKVLDEDGMIRPYEVRNVSNHKGLVCTALIPKNDPTALDERINFSSTHDNPDIKIMFRGTHSLVSAAVDLEKRGPGSKSMQDNRVGLLMAVNKLAREVHGQYPDQKASMTIVGHSLGGSLSELFTSEVHQAIAHQRGVTEEDKGRLNEVWIGDDKRQKSTNKAVLQQIQKNEKAFEGANFDGLAMLENIKTTAVSSGRVHGKESRIAEGFIAINSSKTGSQINIFKSEGDYVPKAASRDIGAGLVKSNLPNVQVSLLSKEAGYRRKEAIKAHTDNPFEGRGKGIDEQNIHFTYHDQSSDASKEKLIHEITKSNKVAHVAQKVYSKTPGDPFAKLAKELASLRESNKEQDLDVNQVLIKPPSPSMLVGYKHQVSSKASSSESSAQNQIEPDKAVSARHKTK